MFSQSTFDQQTCVATKETRPGGAKQVRTKSIIDEVREAQESTGAALSPTLKITCWFFVDLVKLAPTDGSAKSRRYNMTSPSMFGYGKKLSV